jgi:hypothetical protein
MNIFQECQKRVRTASKLGVINETYLPFFKELIKLFIVQLAQLSEVLCLMKQ